MTTMIITSTALLTAGALLGAALYDAVVLAPNLRLVLAAWVATLAALIRLVANR